MIDLSWSHILLVLIVALVVVGPKDLPKLMRTIGQWVGKARQMADQFRASFDEMTKQTELDELRRELEALKAHRPFASIERDLNQPLERPDYPRESGKVETPEAARETAAAEGQPRPTTS